MGTNYYMYIREDIQNYINKGCKGYLFKGMTEWDSLNILTIEKVLKPLVIPNLVSELDEYKFLLGLSDFYQYSRSYEFADFEKDLKPMCATLHKIFEENLKKLVVAVFNMDLSGEVTMTATKFPYRDLLMFRDGPVDDRRVAYILYLEDHVDISSEKSKPSTTLPAQNSLVLFDVKEYNHQKVLDLLSKDTGRLAISGWFHTSRPINEMANSCWMDLKKQAVAMKRGLAPMDAVSHDKDHTSPKRRKVQTF